MFFSSLRRAGALTTPEAEPRQGPSSATRRAVLPVILTILLSVPVLSLLGSCDNGSTSSVFYDWQFVPAGEWTDGYGGTYRISTTNLYYDSGFGDSFMSTLEAADYFSAASGVLIVKLTEVTNATGQYPTNYTIGKYVGVYYKDFTPSHIYLANAIDSSYALIQKDTLPEARNTFTAANMGTYVTSWGSGYTR